MSRNVHEEWLKNNLFNVEHSKFDPYDQLNISPNPDGTITRLLKPPPAPDPNTDPESGQAILSKDVILDPDKKTSLRIYLSSKLTIKNAASAAAAAPRLPIVFYFHGNAWVQCGANYFSLHLSNSYLACLIPAIMIIVDFRLAPENRLPSPYDDAIDALLWLKNQALDTEGDPWLRNYGDFSRCILYGSGVGGNIVFNAAMRAMDVDLRPLKIDGLIINQPIFGGKQRTRAEIEYATDHILPLPAMDLMWELALPKGMDRDHRFCNPLMYNKQKIKYLQRCLVIGFGMNPIIDRQQEFVKMLVNQGVNVQAQFDEIGFHRIELVDRRRGAALDNLVKDFINRC